ncbi:MAG: hypothetical protein BMS9Abin20_1322 [Acidimicrobiia bacterium]|nr:MAG: hypothetical protein BMS9Abin20_1322 [Acidimicrobiia bacterium]
MNTTSSHLPICVHCGTPRPADETLCPTCGKPWIDTSIEEASAPTPPAATVVDAEAGRSPVPPVVPPPPLDDDTGEFSFDDWTMPPERHRSVMVWLAPLLILVVAAGLWAVVFLDAGSVPSTTTVAASGNTLPPVTTSTSSPQTSTSTQPITTTSTSAPAAALFPPPSAWPPQGSPVDPSELMLKAAGIGPIDIGAPIGEAAGILTASFGEAEAAGIDGLCPPDESYWLQWGQLTAIFDGSGADSKFVSYRYEEADAPNSDLGLTTLSGIALGDTVADLQSTYTFYTISFELIASKDHFRLSDGGELLLWGPVTNTEPTGVVEGIYSPSPCQPSS